MTTLARTATVATPVLNGEQEFLRKRFPKSTGNIFLVILLLLTVVLEILRSKGVDLPQAWNDKVRSFLSMYRLPEAFGYGFRSWLVFIAVFAAVFYLTVAIHELGHLLAGLALNFRFSSFSVGPLRLSRSGSGEMAVQFELRHLFRLGGGTEMYPTSDQQLRKRSLYMVSAGPAATILSLLAVAALWPTALRFSMVLNTKTASYVLLLFITCSLLVIWASLWPVLSLGTDGARILTLLRRDGERYAGSWLAIGQIAQKFSAGERLESLSHELIESATAVPDESADALITYPIAYDWAMAHDDLEQAAIRLERCLAAARTAPKNFQEEWIKEAAFFQGVNREDATKAALWLSQMGKRKLQNSLYGVLAEAFTLWNSGKRREAVERLDRGLESFCGAAHPDVSKDADSEQGEKVEGENFCINVREWMQEELDQISPHTPSVE